MKLAVTLLMIGRKSETKKTIGLEKKKSTTQRTHKADAELSSEFNSDERLEFLLKVLYLYSVKKMRSG